MKKLEVGILYSAGPNGAVMTVKPANGKKFTCEEIHKAVGGYFECVISAERYTTVYVNGEGVIHGLPDNEHTWTFAKKSVYMLNGYASDFKMCGNALVVRKVAEVKP
jgi:hypothetical protein